jgi:YggT family protein
VILATSFSNHVADYIVALAGVYTIVIIAYVLSSLAFSAGLRLPYARWSDAILSFLRDVSEPYLRIFRRVLPSIGGLDLSPLIGIIVLQAAARLVASALQA